eukprot:Opistho-2@80504
MVVTFDLGDNVSPIGSIHPRNKQGVADRFFLLARTLVYGETDVVTGGPTFLYASRLQANGPSWATYNITLSFEIGRTGELSLRGTEHCVTCCNNASAFDVFVHPRGWIPALSARVVRSRDPGDGVGIVEVSSIGLPLGVRFAYSNTPECAVYNERHLPSMPVGAYFVDGSLIAYPWFRSSPSATGRHNSRAWIAGPILGGIIGVVVVVALILLLYRRYSHRYQLLDTAETAFALEEMPAALQQG